MDSTLPIIYLSILLTVLLSAGIVVFRQVLKTRRTENTLGRLQKKLNNEKGTAQEYYELGIYSSSIRTQSTIINNFC